VGRSPSFELTTTLIDERKLFSMKRKVIVKDSSRVLNCTIAALVLGVSIAGAKAGDVFIKDTDPNHTFVFDVPNASTAPGTGIQLFHFFGAGGDNQKWTFKPTGDNDGSFYIVNKHSGLVLDVPDSNTDDGVQLIQFGQNGGDNQKWFVKVRLPFGNHGEFQFRVFAGPISSAVTKQFGPAIIVNKHSNKVIDIQGGSLQDGTHILQFSPNGGNNQLFLFLDA
jgi:hypothetical protein